MNVVSISSSVGISSKTSLLSFISPSQPRHNALVSDHRHPLLLFSSNPSSYCKVQSIAASSTNEASDNAQLANDKDDNTRKLRAVLKTSDDRIQLRQLARALAAVLSNVQPDFINPETEARVLEILLSEDDDANDGGDSHDDVYAAELAAILGHIQDVPKASTDTSSDNETQVAATIEKPIPKAATAMMMPTFHGEWRQHVYVQALLLGLVGSLQGSSAALALYNIMDKSKRFLTQSSYLQSRLISILARHGDYSSALRLLRKLRQDSSSSTGGSSNASCYIRVMQACASAGRIDLVKEVGKLSDSQGMPISQQMISTSLLRAFSVVGDAVSAAEEFRKLHSLSGPANAEVYQSLVNAFVAARRGLEAVDLLTESEKGVDAPALVEVIARALIEAEDTVAMSALVEKLGELKIQLRCNRLKNMIPRVPNSNQLLMIFDFFREGRSSSWFVELNALAAAREAGTPLTCSDNEYKAAHRTYVKLFETFRQDPGRLTELHRLFHWMRTDGLKAERVMGRTLVDKFLQGGSKSQTDKAFRIYQLMKEDKVDMPYITNYSVQALSTALAYCGRERWEHVLELLHDVHAATPPGYSGSKHGTRVQTSAITLAGRNGWLKEVISVYNLMLRDGIIPSVITWNAIIAACQKNNRPQLGIQAARAMEAMGVTKDDKTFSTLMSCAGSLKDKDLLMSIYNELKQSDTQPDSICLNTFLWCLTQCGDNEGAIQVYNDWLQESATATASMNGSNDKATESSSTSAASDPTYVELCEELAKSGKWIKSQRALKLQEWMRDQGVNPNTLKRSELMRLAVGAKRQSTSAGQWQQAAQIVANVGLDDADAQRQVVHAPDSASRSVILQAYYNTGNVKAAYEMAELCLKSPIPPTSDDFNALLDAVGQIGAADIAVGLLARMKKEGVRPNTISYTTVINACHTGGRQELVVGLWNEMVREGLEPTIVTVICFFKACSSVAVGPQGIALATKILNDFKGKGHLNSLQVEMVIAYATLLEAYVAHGMYRQGLLLLQETEHNCTSLSWKPTLKMILTPPCDLDGDPLLDFHGMSVSIANLALRGWLLSIKHWLKRGVKMAAPPSGSDTWLIVTGWGRNSPDGVAKVKPEIIRLLGGGHQDGADNNTAAVTTTGPGLGPIPLECRQAPNNLGALEIVASDLYEWLKVANLGFGDEASEEALFRQLFDRAMQYQREKHQGYNRHYGGNSSRQH